MITPSRNLTLGLGVLVVLLSGALVWQSVQLRSPSIQDGGEKPVTTDQPGSIGLGYAMTRVPNPYRVAWGKQVAEDRYVVVESGPTVPQAGKDDLPPLEYVGYFVNVSTGTVTESFRTQVADFFGPDFSLVSDAPDGLAGVRFVQAWEGVYTTTYYLNLETGQLLASLGYMNVMGSAAELTVDGKSYAIAYEPSNACDTGMPGGKATVKGYKIGSRSVSFQKPLVIDCAYTDFAGSAYPSFTEFIVNEADSSLHAILFSDVTPTLSIPLDPFDLSKAFVLERHVGADSTTVYRNLDLKYLLSYPSLWKKAEYRSESNGSSAAFDPNHVSSQKEFETLDKPAGRVWISPSDGVLIDTLGMTKVTIGDGITAYLETFRCSESSCPNPYWVGREDRRYFVTNSAIGVGLTIGVDLSIQDVGNAAVESEISRILASFRFIK